MGGKALAAREDLCGDFLHRIELSLRRAQPLAAEICSADRWVVEKSRCIDTPTGHGFAHPHFIARSAKVVCQPFPAHFERLPRFQKGGAAGRIGAIKLFQQKIRGDFQSCAYLCADCCHEFVKAAVRVRRVCKLHAFPRSHDIDLARPHAVVVGAFRFSRHVRIRLVERVLVGRSLCLDERGIKRLHHRSHKLGLRVSADLEQRLDHLCQIADATVLIRALGVNDVQHVGKSGVLLISQHPRPCCRRRSEFKRVVAADMIGYYHAVAVNLYAVVDRVPVVRVSSGRISDRSPGSVASRCCDPV